LTTRKLDTTIDGTINTIRETLSDFACSNNEENEEHEEDGEDTERGKMSEDAESSWVMFTVT